MKFCSTCGTKLNDDAKFCSTCGTKILITENKIDSTIGFVKSNAQSIKDEIDTSKVITDIKSNAHNVITKEIPSILKKTSRFIIDFLAIVGVLVIIGQIIHYLVTDKVSHFDEVRVNWNNYCCQDIESLFSIFIAELLPSTFLPFIFMFLSGLRRKWMLQIAIVLIMIIISIRVFDTNRLLNYEVEMENSSFP